MKYSRTNAFVTLFFLSILGYGVGVQAQDTLKLPFAIAKGWACASFGTTIQYCVLIMLFPRRTGSSFSTSPMPSKCCILRMKKLIFFERNALANEPSVIGAGNIANTGG